MGPTIVRGLLLFRVGDYHKKNFPGPLCQPTSGAPTLAARIWRLDVSLFKKSAAAAAAA